MITNLLEDFTPTERAVLSKYGFTLDINDLAAVVKKSVKTIQNEISLEVFPIPTTGKGQALRANFRDVAAHLDRACPSHLKRAS